MQTTQRTHLSHELSHKKVEEEKTKVKTKSRITLGLNTANWQYRIDKNKMNKTNVNLTVICQEEKQSIMLDSV